MSGYDDEPRMDHDDPNLHMGAADVATLPDPAERAQDESVLDSLRKKREQLSDQQDVDILIPGYDRQPPYLFARYRLLEGKEIDTIGKKVSKETRGTWDRQVLAAVDSMIAACEGLHFDMGDGIKHPMTLNGDPVLGFGPDLAEALQYEATTAREAVMGLFVGNEIAILQHNVRLSLWMANTNRDVNQEFLGET